MSDSPPGMDKTCPQCQRSLPRTEFHRNRRRVDGLAYYCKACATIRSEASRRKRGVAPARRSAVPVGQGLKWCPDCERIKSLDDFPSTSRKASGRHSYCKPCHNARGKETAQRLYGGIREYHLRRRYGIGQAEFDELLAEQGGFAGCAVTPIRNMWTTIMPPGGCAGYSASTATVVLASSVTVLRGWPGPSRI
ncbi:hypothetical protein GCM10009541_42580 [Micromonospora gifhornensis]|uniref:Recombination endonuclease VII n=1 Tax=Micromonospora gifhornensis TaxID=84594 RepID=A0ABQ4IAN5_9ACTN|nr:hypothetical protein Vgi01_16630 [Micromonospora gifhornensis]